jgi:hypothetical protein
MGLTWLVHGVFDDRPRDRLPGVARYRLPPVMAFQSTVPIALGVVATSWDLDRVRGRGWPYRTARRHPGAVALPKDWLEMPVTAAWSALFAGFVTSRAGPLRERIGQSRRGQGEALWALRGTCSQRGRDATESSIPSTTGGARPGGGTTRPRDRQEGRLPRNTVPDDGTDVASSERC